MSERDECLSFLPLCHIFERMVGHYTMLQAGAVINYATSFDTVVTELPEVRPTILASVPRLYEKIYARVVDKASKGGGAQARDLRLGPRDRREAPRLPAGAASTCPPWLGARRTASPTRSSFAKLRQRLGGRIRLLLSGGAPLNPDICRFFIAAGLTLLEGYGLTETSPVIAFNTAGNAQAGHRRPADSGRRGADRRRTARS